MDISHATKVNITPTLFMILDAEKNSIMIKKREEASNGMPSFMAPQMAIEFTFEELQKIINVFKMIILTKSGWKEKEKP